MERNSKWIVTLATVVLLGGCVDTPSIVIDAGPPPPPADPCAVIDGGGLDGGPVTRLYVINVLQFPTPTGAEEEQLDGFDLDGTSATVCGQMDWLPTRTISCVGGIGADYGVDNSLGAFLEGLTNDAIQQRVDKGVDVLMLQVDDIDDFVDDPSVVVTAFVATAPVGVAVTHVGVCAPDAGADPGCRFSAGQTFDIVRPPPSDRGALTGVRYGSASIVHGHLVAAAAEMPLTLTLSFFGAAGPILPIRVHGARLDARITDTALTTGVLGGWVDDAEVLDSLTASPVLCTYAGTVAPILGMQSDLMPTNVGPCTFSATDGGIGPTAHHCPYNSVCDPTTRQCVSCSEASLAFDFDAVTAVLGAIVEPVTMDAGSGCGLDGGHD